MGLTEYGISNSYYPIINFLTAHGKLPYYAVYDALFCPKFGGKNKDACYTWVVLVLYLYKCF